MRSFLYTFIFLLGYLFIPFASEAQVVITFPMERIVFQRDNSNKATVQISGNYYQSVDRIEAKLTPVNGGTAIDWTTMSQVSNGFFSGSVSVTGGWYKLEVRGVSGSTIVNAQAVERVGVGEVFVIAGQSNAQGITDSRVTPSEPNDDRVTIADASNYANGSSSTEPNFYLYNSNTAASSSYPQMPSYKKLSANDRVAPVGLTAWYWGKVGDALAQRLNVPILFYNAAFASTTVKNWRESSEGNRTQNRYCTTCGEAGYFPAGYPYNNLKNTLNYYVSLTGVRSVLWHQGEADDATSQTPTAQYVSDLTSVIQKSRTDMGYNQLSWVVARVSYNSGLTWQPVINAQNQIISSVANVYAGPSTDNVDIPRLGPPYDVHFTTNGLSSAAEVWVNSILTSNVLTNSTPKLANPLVNITATCASNNSLTLSVPNQNPYSWSNGQAGASITVGSGNAYMAKIKNGNTTIFSFPYKVPDRPAIGGNILQDGSSVYYCEGVTPTLASNYNTGNTWSTGATTQSITGATGETYTLTYKDVLGCTYTSESITLGQRPRPSQPSITADGALSYCAGTDRTLTTTQDAAGYIWSNGANTKSIKPQTSSTYSVQIIDANQCRSVASAGIQITVNPIPAKPTIQANRTIDGTRTVTICANETVELTSSTSEGTYLWNYNNATTSSITTNTARSYQVQTISTANCPSPSSDPVLVKVNALPAKPTATVVSGVLAFCEGGTVTLRANTTQTPSWILAEQTVSSTALVTAKISGDYYAQATDANGCKNRSDKVTVSVRPNPDVPKIAQVGPYTLQAQANVPGTRNSWITGSDTSTFNSVFFKPLKEGTYRVKSVIEYNIAPVGKFECTSATSAAFTYAYDANQDGFVVYPNPSPTGAFTLETKENWQGAEVSVTTMSGTVIYNGRINEFNERKFIDLGRLPGIYIIRLKADGFERSKRLTIVP
ncbi:sialate O-acetylesterase [Siphonobacter sp. SORGH_AS_0500]|uniref:sialate O-acetylesterase n=1 Tax=Siphonobacter sp. SORGH_AS_0500 TaxID=1864824 RepID=UPI00285E8654|nr:sialate O-acetylesterase [Siphonobacter sp. SORGH_AS_0500]MDR6193990.1 hypothetical protein [Siphonobacter sp. SORGH_AS_0500]